MYDQKGESRIVKMTYAFQPSPGFCIWVCMLIIFFSKKKCRSHFDLQKKIVKKTALYVKKSSSAGLLENWCPSGPHSYKTNGKKSAQSELQFKFYGCFFVDFEPFSEKEPKNYQKTSLKIEL